MRKIIPLIIACLFFAQAKAQYVNIPDTNFRKFLIAYYPACFNGTGQMDTTCVSIVNAKGISLSFYGTGIDNISSINGLQYFKGLKRLDIDWLNDSPSSFYKFKNPYFPINLDTLILGTGMMAWNIDFDFPPNLKYYSNEFWSIGSYITDSLPNSLQYFKSQSFTYAGGGAFKLPDSLRYFDVPNSIGAKIDSLADLPSQLKYFSCQDCKIKKIGTLPNSLEYLNLNYNPLGLLMPNFITLPPNLKFFDCGLTGLTQLPVLPNGLQYLFCNNNQLTHLPNLPNSLLALNCSNNIDYTKPASGINILPVIPPNLVSLACEYNTITSIPNLPNSLTAFSCHHNLLTSLPSIPNQLKKLDCFDNKLISLPSFPTSDSFTTVNCQNNLLANLPAMPNNITHFFVIIICCKTFRHCLLA